MTRVVGVPRHYTDQAIDPAKSAKTKAQLKESFEPSDEIEEQHDNDIVLAKATEARQDQSPNKQSPDIETADKLSRDDVQPCIC